VLISLTLEVVAIQMHGRDSELPVEEINWSQAPKYLWNDLINLAVHNRKVDHLSMTSRAFTIGTSKFNKLKRR
jgi:hypothetical protein